MEAPGSGSGSGAAEPVEEDRIDEPASNANASSPTAAAPPPPPPPLHLDQAGGGADGSTPATVVEPRKGKETSSSSEPRGQQQQQPNAAAHPLDPKLVARQRFIERLIQAQAAYEEGNRRREQQVESPHARGALPGKEKEKKLPQVKVRPRPEKGKSLWSRLKNKIFCREGLPGGQIRSEHVRHQTLPINEVRNYYMVSSNEANHLDAYSEIRLVIGDGECFYRSFIFSYLEQVIDRQDTHEEDRLLHVVERVPTQHANLGWNSKFSRSCRAFKELIEKVMRWKGTESTSSRCKEKLLEFFSTYDETKDIFAFLRLLVAVEICSHRTVYEPIIESDRGNCSLEAWCLEHVIPARVDADHVMLVALARALEVPLRVESFQQGYARDIYTGPGVPRPSVTLLYTGNHYNIIYPRAPSAESSSHQASQREDPADQSSSHQASQREDPAGQS